MKAKYKKVLLIDDDESLSRVLSYQLEQMGFIVTASTDGNTGLELLKANSFDIAITDLQLPDISGMELLQTLRRFDKNIIVIIITAYGTVENAIEAVKLGADDYLTKPFGKETLRFTIEKAIRLRELQAENIQLKHELFDKYDFGNILGKSAVMQNALKLAAQVAQSDATVLLQGESGTGKELFARAIHYNSPRKNKPLVTVNCPSIPENLIESELFGHVKGAFTGALKDRKGKFELADESTIFLDEIGDLRQDVQARLLRTLQEMEFERVGDSTTQKVDVRVLAATNKDLEEMVKSGQFREDLYYRLNVVTIVVPPLRDRADEIPFLVEYFMQKYGQNRNMSITNGALEILMQYPWPGNVRELQNTIERAMVISKQNVIDEGLLEPIKRKLGQFQRDAVPNHNAENLSLESIERRAIENALKSAGWNQTRAAQLLKIPRHVLIYRMQKLNIKATGN
ncbi:MAG: sigma-54 dependent transcriptional regulator [bacterium]|nr:sigma-54 dependent transcriptional regulator [bacterium]